MHTKKYIAAAYSYFLVHDVEETRNSIIHNTVRNPVLRYGPRLNQANLKRRCVRILHDIANTTDPAALAYYNNKLQQSELVLSAIALQRARIDDTESLENFRQGTQDVYGVPKPQLAAAIVKYLEQRAHEQPELLEYWHYINEHISTGHIEAGLVRPSQEVFEQCRQYFFRYAPWLLEEWRELEKKPLLEMVMVALEQTGAQQLGWTVELSPGGSHANVVYAHEKVLVGKYYQPYTKLSNSQVAIHEVYGHVNRHIKSGGKTFPSWESEGVAVMIEQMLPPLYSVRRTHRYLAISLGWGIFGKAMDFRDTYEIIWRAMMILGVKSKEQAHMRAFNECARAFRGGRPDMPGAVLTKDIAYLEGNLKVWHYIEDNVNSYESFVDLIEGRTQVPA